MTDFITPFAKYILQCKSVSENKLFINAVHAQDGVKQLVTSQIDRAQDKEFVDGSVLHKVIFTIFDFRSISFNALVHFSSALEYVLLLRCSNLEKGLITAIGIAAATRPAARSHRFSRPSM